MKTVYESTIVAPPFFDSPGDAEFLIDKIRELGWPIIVARFDDVNAIEAAFRLEEINHELASRGLPTFPPVRRRRLSDPAS